MVERVTKKDLRRKYPDELKRKIAKAYKSGQYSYGVLALAYGLTDKSVVKEFVRWYDRQPEILVDISIMDALEMKQNDSAGRWLFKITYRPTAHAHPRHYESQCGE